MSTTSNLVKKLSPSVSFAPLSIKPLITKKRNGGLENYGMVVHDKIVHTDCVMFRTIGDPVNGTKTYITGLNEDTDEIQDTKDLEVKNAKIANIRRKVAKYERYLASNHVLDPEQKDIENDKDFWSKVKTFRSSFQGVTTPTYWDNLNAVMTNDGVILDPDNLRHQLIVDCIDAGGMVMIAKSREDAEKGNFKFYLDKKEKSADTESQEDMFRDKAGSKLLALRENDTEKMFYIVKIISDDSLYFKTGKNATPLGSQYKEITNFLEGKGKESGKLRACKQFLDLVELRLDELKVRAVLRDSILMRIVVINDSMLMHLRSSTMLGSSEEEAVMYLKNPANHKKVFDVMVEEVDKHWRK